MRSRPRPRDPIASAVSSRAGRGVQPVADERRAAAPAPSIHSCTRSAPDAGARDAETGEHEGDPHRERIVPAEQQREVVAGGGRPRAAARRGTTWTNGMTSASAAGDEEQRARAERRGTGAARRNRIAYAGRMTKTGTPVAMSAMPSSHSRHARSDEAQPRRAHAPRRPAASRPPVTRPIETPASVAKRIDDRPLDDARSRSTGSAHVERARSRAGAPRTCRAPRGRARGRRPRCAAGRSGAPSGTRGTGASASSLRLAQRPAAPGQSCRSSQTRSAFWAWRRFSASSQTTLCGPSMTSASTS